MISKRKNIIKKILKEFVDADGGIIGGDRNVTNDSEIETGPVQKPYNDDSDYEKGVSTTSDRASRYRQDIPWFAVYSYGGQKGTVPVNEVTLEEDLVKKKNSNDVVEKDKDVKTDKIIDSIDNNELSVNQLEKIKQIVLDKIKEKNG
jgi:hypothetical protein